MLKSKINLCRQHKLFHTIIYLLQLSLLMLCIFLNHSSPLQKEDLDTVCALLSSSSCRVLTSLSESDKLVESLLMDLYSSYSRGIPFLSYSTGLVYHAMSLKSCNFQKKFCNLYLWLYLCYHPTLLVSTQNCCLVGTLYLLNNSVMHYSSDLILLDLDVSMGYPD